jgi:cyclohexanone monooxygenase
MSLVWTEECRSWYKAGNSFGKVLALWPGSTVHYLETLKSPRWEDWNYTYPANRNKYTYLGNGHSTVEAHNGDLSYYIRNKDDSYVDPVLKKSQAEAEPKANGGPIAGLKAMVGK